MNDEELSQRRFRWVVLPVAAFLMLFGVVMVALVAIVRIPITSPLPFVASDFGNRAIITAVACAWLLLGLGLAFRSRSSWLATLAFIVLNAAFGCILGFAGPPNGPLSKADVPTGLWETMGVVNGVFCLVLGWALHRSTRCVFDQRRAPSDGLAL